MGYGKTTEALMLCVIERWLLCVIERWLHIAPIFISDDPVVPGTSGTSQRRRARTVIDLPDDDEFPSNRRGVIRNRRRAPAQGKYTGKTIISCNAGQWCIMHALVYPVGKRRNKGVECGSRG